MLKRYLFAAILVGAIVNPVQAAVEPIGEWVVADGTARVRIEPCNGALWGVIAWAREPGTDENNPDPAKRNRSILGLPILLAMKKVEANRWSGHVYNAENGKTYNASITLIAENTLRIEGCVFGGFFCGGENWTRAAPQQNSSQNQQTSLQKQQSPSKKDPAKTASIQKDVCP